MNQKNMPTGIIGAIMLFALVAFRIINILNNGTMRPIVLIYYLGVVAIGVGVLMSNYIISIVGLAACVMCELYWVVVEIKDGDILVGILYELSFLIAYILLIVLMLPYISNSFSAENIRNLWFLPGALIAVGYLPLFIYSNINSYHYIIENFKYVFLSVLQIAAYFLIGHSICNRQLVNSVAVAGCVAATVMPVAPAANVAPSVQAGQMAYLKPAGNAATPASPAHSVQVAQTANERPAANAAPPVTPAPSAQVAQTANERPAANAAPPVTPAPSAQVAQTANERPAANAAPPVTPAPSAQVAQTANGEPAKTNDTPSISLESMKMLRNYKELLDEGILTQEEFNEIKKRILG